MIRHRFALLLITLCAAAGCGNVHPVHWTKMGVSASRGDVGAIRERMEMDPEAGKYVSQAEAYTEAWIESAILDHDADSLREVLETRPALNVKLPRTKKKPLKLARDVGFTEGARMLREAGAR